MTKFLLSTEMNGLMMHVATVVMLLAVSFVLYVLVQVVTYV